MIITTDATRFSRIWLSLIKYDVIHILTLIKLVELIFLTFSCRLNFYYYSYIIECSQLKTPRSLTNVQKLLGKCCLNHFYLSESFYSVRSSSYLCTSLPWSVPICFCAFTRQLFPIPELLIATKSTSMVHFCCRSHYSIQHLGGPSCCLFSTQERWIELTLLAMMSTRCYFSIMLFNTCWLISSSWTVLFGALL